MVEFWPSDLKVPDSTPGHSSSFFLFLPLEFQFLKVFTFYWYSRSKTTISFPLGASKSATEVICTISSHWDLNPGPLVSKSNALSIRPRGKWTFRDENFWKHSHWFPFWPPLPTSDRVKVGQLMKDIQFWSIEEIYFFLTHIHKKRKNIMSFVHMNEISLLKVVSYQSLLAIFTNWNFNLYILKEIDPSIIWLEKLKFQQIFRIQFLHAIKRRCFSVQ